MDSTRSWNEVKKEIDCLTQEELDEISLKVKIIGEVLAARKRRGLTQQELGELTGVDQAVIARLENNRMDPRLTTVLKILRPLGMTLKVAPLESHAK